MKTSEEYVKLAEIEISKSKDYGAFSFADRQLSAENANAYATLGLVAATKECHPYFFGPASGYNVVDNETGG